MMIVILNVHAGKAAKFGSAVRSIFSQLNDLSGPGMAGRRHDTRPVPETDSVFTEPAFAPGLRRFASARRCSRCSDLRLVFR
jgi:hypothetical protein